MTDRTQQPSELDGPKVQRRVEEQGAEECDWPSYFYSVGGKLAWSHTHTMCEQKITARVESIMESLLLVFGQSTSFNYLTLTLLLTEERGRRSQRG